MRPEDQLQKRVTEALQGYLLATGQRLAMGERGQAELLLARFFRLGHTEAELTAVRRRLAPAPRLTDLLALDMEQKCSAFARQLAATGPEWFRPEIVAAPVEPVPAGTPAEEQAARARALDGLRATSEWIKSGCQGPGPGGVTV